jgi:hypothetical protein
VDWTVLSFGAGSSHVQWTGLSYPSGQATHMFSELDCPILRGRQHAFVITGMESPPNYEAAIPFSASLSPWHALDKTESSDDEVRR